MKDSLPSEPTISLALKCFLLLKLISTNSSVISKASIVVFGNNDIFFSFFAISNKVLIMSLFFIFQPRVSEPSLEKVLVASIAR